jgi:hypothetical protein
MEILLIDVGALGLFLGYMAIVYWHGISHEVQRAACKADQNDSARRPDAIRHCADERSRAVTS